MKKYTVYLKDYNKGSTSPIDNISAPADFTAAQYIAACKANGVQWYADGDPCEIILVENNEKE